MRKHKSVVAILLAVMMIFTFMPTMAFATTETKGTYPDPEQPSDSIEYTAVWSDDFSKVTIGDDTFDTVRTANLTGNQWTPSRDRRFTGMMTATIDVTGWSATIANRYRGLSVNYFDMDNAETRIGTNVIASTYTQSDFENIWVYDEDEDEWGWAAAPTIYFTLPTYADGYADLHANTKNTKVAAPDTFVWNAKLKGAEGYESGLDTPQNFTLKTTFSVPSGSSAAASACYMKGAIADKNVTVKANALTPATARYYIDSTSNKAMVVSGTTAAADAHTLYVPYDGNTHTVVGDTVPGWTATFAIYNPSTAKYEDGTVSIKDVLDDDIEVRVTYKKSGMTDRVFYFNVNALSADADLGFDTSLSVTDPINVMGTKTESVTYAGDEDDDFITRTESWAYSYVDYVDGNITYEESGSVYNPMDYVAVKPFIRTITKSTSKAGDVYNEWLRAMNTANTNAVAANNAELVNYVKDFYEVTETPTKSDPNTIKLVLKEKALSSAQIKDLNKKYEQLLKNIDIDDDFARNATLKINVAPANDKVDDITFTGVTTKAFKAKKKTKKLAKTKTFKVAAVADSGNVITFSATSSNAKVSIDATGKVTVKKGLKKGTKVKLVVKAKTAAGNGYKATSAEKTYTIKIK